MDKQKLAAQSITFRPITDDDLEFLYRVYASTRADEMAMTGWNQEEIENFLHMQFDLQHKQYVQNYQDAAFEIILFKGKPVGRLYVNRGKKEIRIIDIALLIEYRRKGIGSGIMKELIAEANHANVPLSLHVEYNNPAMGLYLRLGFEKKDLRGVYYFMEKLPEAQADPRPGE